MFNIGTALSVANCLSRVLSLSETVDLKLDRLMSSKLDAGRDILMRSIKSKDENRINLINQSIPLLSEAIKLETTYKRIAISHLLLSAAYVEIGEFEIALKITENVKELQTDSTKLAINAFTGMWNPIYGIKGTISLGKIFYRDISGANKSEDDLHCLINNEVP